MAPPAPAPGRQVNLVQALALLLAFLLIAGVGGVLAAGLVLPAVAGVSVAADSATKVFSDLPTALEEQPLSEKSTVLANDGKTVLATFYLENRIVVPLDKIAPIMRKAVVAIEDKRFYEHGGIDPAGMARAAAKNALTSDLQGASTLTQQYVKNVLIEAAARANDDAGIAAAREASGNAGISRKLREAKLAIALEQKYSKDEILSRYLNIAQFGASVYGAEAASQFYFSKSAKDLNFLEAATLAGVTQSPTKWDPVVNPKGSTTRRNLVLKRMYDQGMIKQNEYDYGIKAKIGPKDPKDPKNAAKGYTDIQRTGLGCMAANAVASSGYFCDYVTKVITNNKAFGATAADRQQLLYRGGLTITTTLSRHQQQIADTEVKNGVPVNDPSGIASAITVVQPGTGKILAMAQNRTFSKLQKAGARETAINYNADFAYGGSKGFAPGSTFKPFTLLQWIKEGHSLTEVLNAPRRTFYLSEFNAPCSNIGGGSWPVGNAEGNGGTMSVQDATKNSVNSAYVLMATKLNLCGIFDGAKALGVRQATGEDYGIRPANVLGSDGVSPLAMANAFATFAAGGKYCEPIAITKVVDTDGKELAVPQSNCRQALEPRIAALMNEALSHVYEGTGRGIGALDRPSAGKTGTTSENEYTWFVGYTPQLAAAVWVGHSEGMSPMKDVIVNGQFIRRMFGSSVAGPTWKRFMTQALAGTPVEGFAPPSGADLVGSTVSIPDVVGRSPADARAVLAASGFNVTTSPTQAASAAAAGAVASTSPPAGSRVAKGTVVTLTISSGPAPAAPAADTQPAETQPAAPKEPASNDQGNGERKKRDKG